VSACTSRSCRAPVLRLIHRRTRNPVPIDADPSDDGNVRVLREAGEYEVLAGDALAAARANGEPLHLNHFVTCKDKKRWQARRQRA
jgi:hypothetical protein